MEHYIPSKNISHNEAYRGRMTTENESRRRKLITVRIIITGNMKHYLNDFAQ